MTFSVKNIAFFIVIIFLVTSCNPFQKLVKSDNVPLKYDKAKEYFNKKEYNKCILLLETIIPIYRPTKEAEKINYMYAFSEYALGDYLSSSMRFKELYETYPFGEFAEESLFLYAYNLFLLSPSIELDQSTTSNAIDALQLFITKYPNSKRVEEANKAMDELAAKLETKDFNTAYMYYRIEEYKAAIWSLKKFLEKYPATEKKNEIIYLILSAQYHFAINSIEEKKRERLNDVVYYYRENAETLKKSSFAKNSENIYTSTLNHLKKLK